MYRGGRYRAVGKWLAFCRKTMTQEEYSEYFHPILIKMMQLTWSDEHGGVWVCHIADRHH